MPINQNAHGHSKLHWWYPRIHEHSTANLQHDLFRLLMRVTASDTRTSGIAGAAESTSSQAQPDVVPCHFYYKAGGSTSC